MLHHVQTEDVSMATHSLPGSSLTCPQWPQPRVPHFLFLVPSTRWVTEEQTFTHHHSLDIYSLYRKLFVQLFCVCGPEEQNQVEVSHSEFILKQSHNYPEDTGTASDSRVWRYIYWTLIILRIKPTNHWNKKTSIFSFPLLQNLRNQCEHMNVKIFMYQISLFWIVETFSAVGIIIIIFSAAIM